VGLEEARRVKAALSRDAADALGRVVRADGPVTVAVGIGPAPDGYGIVVRHTGAPRLARELAERGRELGSSCDVRDIGTVRPLPWTPGTLQGRVRPLRPGLSVAHVAVTAGTIGAFVRTADTDAVVHVLSNNHVVADSDRGRPGDVVVQPGPADGGQADGDRIGTLDWIVPMLAGEPNLVDAATVRLDDDVDVDETYPVGDLAGWADADVDLDVEKVGRTTGLTRGRVSAIELDGLTVLYPTGVITFDGQIEVVGDGSGPFSAGGDSGSLVYDPVTREAIGLLFAGSEQGGPDGRGLTYCNPIGAVLDALDVEFVPATAGVTGGDDAGSTAPAADARVAKREVAARLRDDPRVVGVGITRWHGRYAVRVNVVDAGDAPAVPSTVHGVSVEVVAVGRIRPIRPD
jgi:hypothetical protein